MRHIFIGFALMLTAASCNPFTTSTTVGLIKTENGGTDWQFKNTIDGDNSGNLNESRFSSIRFAPDNSEVLYAGSYDDGLFQTTSSGNSWKRILSKIGVYDVAINSFNPAELFVGGFFADHGKVLTSKDGGKSWIEIYNEESTGNAVRALALNPTNPQNIVIGLSSGAVNASSDSGITWKSLLTFNDKINQIAWTTDGLYLMVQGKGLYKSIDGGNNFQNLTASLLPVSGTFDSFAGQKPITVFNHFAISGVDKNTLYITSDGGFFKTTNEGGAWSAMNLPLTTKDRDIAIRAVALSTPADNYVYVSAGATVYKSVNGGDSWQTQAITTGGFVNTLAVNPELPQVVYGGLYVSK